MATKLYALGNATKSGAALTSTTSDKDAVTINSGTVRRTGGTDGDFIQIPKCSESKYYKDHHILLQPFDGSWIVSLWSDDGHDGLLYWNSANEYSILHPLAGSDQADTATILIWFDNGVLTVGYYAWLER